MLIFNILMIKSLKFILKIFVLFNLFIYKILLGFIFFEIN